MKRNFHIMFTVCSNSFGDIIKTTFGIIDISTIAERVKLSKCWVSRHTLYVAPCVIYIACIYRVCLVDDFYKIEKYICLAGDIKLSPATVSITI